MNIERVVSQYLNAWNETDSSARGLALAGLCTDDCQYVDPLAAVSGPAALSALIGSVQAQLRGLQFTLGGRIDAHHGQARFTWHAAAEGAPEPVVVGFDVVVLDGDRIRSVYGFLDRVPS